MSTHNDTRQMQVAAVIARCPHCRLKQHKFDVAQIGREVRCPSTRKVFTIVGPCQKQSEPLAEELLPPEIAALVDGERVPNPQIVITPESLERETGIVVGAHETTRLAYHVQRDEIAAEARRIARLPMGEREAEILVALKTTIKDETGLRYAVIVELWLRHEAAELAAHWARWHAAHPALPKISNDTEYASLPSGSRFIAPDGSTRVKPLSSNQLH